MEKKQMDFALIEDEEAIVSNTNNTEKRKETKTKSRTTKKGKTATKSKKTSKKKNK